MVCAHSQTSSLVDGIIRDNKRAEQHEIMKFLKNVFRRLLLSWIIKNFVLVKRHDN